MVKGKIVKDILLWNLATEVVAYSSCEELLLPRAMGNKAVLWEFE